MFSTLQNFRELNSWTLLTPRNLSSFRSTSVRQNFDHLHFFNQSEDSRPVKCERSVDCQNVVHTTLVRSYISATKGT